LENPPAVDETAMRGLGKSLCAFMRFPKSWHFSQKCQLFFWWAIKQNLTLPHQNNKSNWFISLEGFFWRHSTKSFEEQKLLTS